MRLGALRVPRESAVFAGAVAVFVDGTFLRAHSSHSPLVPALLLQAHLRCNTRPGVGMNAGVPVVLGCAVAYVFISTAHAVAGVAPDFLSALCNKFDFDPKTPAHLLSIPNV